jgi:hypothetical protein
LANGIPKKPEFRKVEIRVPQENSFTESI